MVDVQGIVGLHRRGSSRPEIGVLPCRLCGEGMSLFKGRKAGGLFANCGCGARFHFEAGSRARAQIVKEAGIKE